MSSRIHAAQLSGLSPDLVDIEVDISKGLKSFCIVGLPDSAVKEAKDRITSAIKNSGLKSPQKGNKKIIISLAPADLRKEGPVFDLAIALGYLHAAEIINCSMEKRLFLGELSLDGTLRPIKGVLLITNKAKEAGFTEIFLPKENAKEAALVPEIAVFGARTLAEVVGHLANSDEVDEDFPIEKIKIDQTAETKIEIKELEQNSIDLLDIAGQESAKRGLEVAAAGGHNIAFWGPPGTGKTMLAKALTGILPPLTLPETLEVTGVQSAVGALTSDYATEPPFRSPHHTSSYVAMVGGGAVPRPGEITLAHRGVLFMDEFPEFDRRVIEAMRQPLEDRIISVSRAFGQARFPASFILVAALNPCPCGNRGSSKRPCDCSGGTLARYAKRISGPVIDRIDLWIFVGEVDHSKLSSGGAESSKVVSARIATARKIQTDRFKNEAVSNNAEMGVKELKKYGKLTPDLEKMLATSAAKLNLSARGYHRTIKIARTIADLDGSKEIKEQHLLEAITFRSERLKEVMRF